MTSFPDGCHSIREAGYGAYEAPDFEEDLDNLLASVLNILHRLLHLIFIKAYAVDGKTKFDRETVVKLSKTT